MLCHVVSCNALFVLCCFVCFVFSGGASFCGVLLRSYFASLFCRCGESAVGGGVGGW